MKKVQKLAELWVELTAELKAVQTVVLMVEPMVDLKAGQKVALMVARRVASLGLQWAVKKAEK